jgi:hypothetical protein
MPQRKCTRTKENVKHVSKRIVLPIEIERYKEIVGKPEAYRACIDEMKSRYPELFPAEIENSYRWHDQRTSKKMPEIEWRRIKVPGKEKDQVYTIVPSGVMP